MSEVLNDDQIIAQAGLRKPLLFEAASLLTNALGWPAAAPRSLAEFAEMLKNTKK